MTHRYFSVAPGRVAVAFLILCVLYQSAEGIGARLLQNEIIQDGLMVSAVAAAWPVGRWILRWKGYAAYGLEWQSRAPLWLGAGVALYLLGKAAAIAIGLQIGVYVRTSTSVGTLSIGTISFLLLATFTASIAEDVITRGFWWRVKPVAATPARFVIASAVIYLLNHVFRLSKGPSEWFMLICLGIAYATALARTNSLWAAIGLHWGWNLSNGLADGLISIDANPALTPYLSGITNLVITLIVLILPIWRRPREAASG